MISTTVLVVPGHMAVWYSSSDSAGSTPSVNSTMYPEEYAAFEKAS